MKLSPARFSRLRASYTARWTAIFRDDIHMHIHIAYIKVVLQARHDPARICGCDIARR